MNDPSDTNTTVKLPDDLRSKILDALLETHHTTFYTVISVVQATCFGFLALMSFEQHRHYDFFDWMLAANTLIIIGLVWNGFVRGFVILTYVPKLIDGLMPFTLGAAQCFAAYFVGHDPHDWYWSIAALALIGFIGYVNAEINARLNPRENEHILSFYHHYLRILQGSSMFVVAVCSGVAYFADWTKEILVLFSFVVTTGYALGEEVLWLRMERFARGED